MNVLWRKLAKKSPHAPERQSTEEALEKVRCWKAVNGIGAIAEVWADVDGQTNGGCRKMKKKVSIEVEEQFLVTKRSVSSVGATGGVGE
jgi:hypothetical protein